MGGCEYEVNSPLGVGWEFLSHVNKTHNIQYIIQNMSEIHVLKITNVHVFFMALGLNDVVMAMGGKSIILAIGMGGPCKSRLFWAQVALASLVAPFNGPKTPPPSPVSQLSFFLSLLVPRRSSLLTGRGVGRDQIIRRREYLVRYKSFDTLCTKPSCQGCIPV